MSREMRTGESGDKLSTDIAFASVPFTFGAWVYLRDQAGTQTVLTLGGNDDLNFNLGASIGMPAIEISRAEDLYIAHSTGGTVPSGAWTWIELWVNWNVPEVKFYINTTLLTTVVDNEGVGDWPGLSGLRLGNLIMDGAPLRGRIQEAAWFVAGELTAAQRDLIVNHQWSPMLLGLASYGWHLLGDQSPEPAAVGGVNLTVTGAVQAAHKEAFMGFAQQRRRARQVRHFLL